MDDEKALLWAAVEDYAGLWTAPWELRTLHPEATDNELQTRAREILQRYLSQGLIRLFTCQEPDGEPLVMSDDAARDLLASEAAWLEPGEDWLANQFSATSLGEAAYAELLSTHDRGTAL